MLDPNVAQSLTPAIAAANPAPAADAGAAGPTGARSETDADLPFAAVLRRQLAQPDDAKNAAQAKGLREVRARNDSGQADASADAQAAIFAWLAPLMAAAAPSVAAATGQDGEAPPADFADISTAAAVPASTDSITASSVLPDPTASSALPDPIAASALPNPMAASSASPDSVAASALPDPAASGLSNPIATPVLPGSTASALPDEGSKAAATALPGLPSAAEFHSLAANAKSSSGMATMPTDVAAEPPARPEAAGAATQPSAILAGAKSMAAESAAAGNGSSAGTVPTGFDSLLNAAQTAATAHAATAARTPQPTAPAPDAAATSVATPVGAPGWSAEVGDKLAWMVGRNETRAELVLNPPQMGRIEVSLSLNGNQANALFVSANPAVREALENAVPQLRETLQDAGIALGQAQVGAESFRQQTAHGRENSDNSRHAAERGADVTVGASVVAEPALRRGNGLIDTFA